MATKNAVRDRFQYDVFVSYSHVDGAFVLDWLVPKLRGAGLRVCLDIDCFRGGADIFDEAERAVRTSERTLVVISANWSRGDWTKFERRLVQALDVGARRRRVVPIKLDSSRMPRTLVGLVYRDFSDAGQHDEVFKRLLKDVTPRVGWCASVEVKPLRVIASAVATYQPRLTRETFETTRAQFLEYIRQRYQYLEFKGMGVTDRVPLRIGLVEMYVPLKVVVRDSRPPTRERAAALGREGANDGRAPVLDLIRTRSVVVILGDPGAGKTTLLQYLSLALASDQNDLHLGRRLPVLVPVAAYATALAVRDVRLDEFIGEHYRNRGLDLPIGDLVSDAIATGQALLLLDGLDEVKGLSARCLLVDRVIDFITAHRGAGNKFLITSRSIGYDKVRPVLDDLAECTIVDFDDADITAFLDRWTAAVERAAGSGAAAAQVAASREQSALADVLGRNPGVRRLAANPLLLTILALMKRQGVMLPDRRVELYENYVQTLLKHWQVARSLDRPRERPLAVGDTVRVLSSLALWMHETTPGVGLVDLPQIERALVRIFRARHDPEPREAAARLLEDAGDYAGLLTERGKGQFGFLHLTFQEYLAGVAIANLGQQNVRPAVAMIAKRLPSPEWREVILLAIEYLGVVQRRDEAAGAVIERLIREAPGPPGVAVAVAGEAAADAAPDGVAAKSLSVLIKALSATMRNADAVKPPVRAAAGAALGRIGDPRFRRDTWFLPNEPLLGFVKVPGGSFEMGSDKATDPTAYSEELDQHSVELPAFYIARWPVTVAQFRAFVEAPDNEGFQPGDPDCLRGVANHPVVWVSWHEALAYSRWLTKKLRAWEGTPPPLRRLLNGAPGTEWQVTLPSEAEWEKAARGADARIYPWGEKADPNRANYDDTGINGTSAVGCFPGWASPYGVEELSGNVWEWTRSLWKEFPYEPDYSGRERERLEAGNDVARVVRGGAFYSFEGLVRAAIRSRNSPVNRHYYLGCRLVVSPFRP